MPKGSERTIRLFETFVLNKEAADLKSDVETYNALIGERPTEAQQALNDIIKEKQRLNPKGKYDEEEWIVGNLLRKKK